MKKILQLSFLILGIVIGAGYASGREIWLFFGANGGRAISLFTVLFGVCCYSILDISSKKQTNHYQQILATIVNDKLTWLYDLLMFVYLILTIVIMIAGSGAALEVYQLPSWIGISLIAIMMVWAFSFSLDQVIEINTILLPVLLITLLAILMIFIKREPSIEHVSMSKMNYFKAISFTSVNLLPIISVVGAIGNKIKTKKEVIYTALISTVILAGLSYIYNYSLTLIHAEIDLFEMPIYGILIRFPSFVLLFVTIIIWVAIFSTALGALLGLITRIKNNYNISQIKVALILTLLLVPFSLTGFQFLIELIYPIYGLLNLYLLLKLILYPIKDCRVEK
ncbi:hypothetical protein [Amphibacillus indicireducens]|uniref:Membrane protein n=1 Tax=Amphibacillus indicireducens TaxID=1076330 RepID=A0ABP7W0G5_9BACI